MVSLISQKAIDMKLKVIKTKKEYQAYLDWVDELFDKKVSPNSTEGEKLQVALRLMKQYEDKHYPIPASILLS
jgi:HTH-type transcriptional regulator/antitoxin HigA